ncbi:hypothetical protein BH11MYX3_BH11MYX3_17050 [soil metagenome]
MRTFGMDQKMDTMSFEAFAQKLAADAQYP